MNSRAPETFSHPSWHRQTSSLTKTLSGVVALALLTGCGGGGGSSTSGGTAIVVTPVSPTPTGQSVSAPALSNFTATLSENQSSISVGGTVSYTFTLANTSATAATVIAGTSGGVNVPIVGLHVSDPAGLIVYPPASQPGVRPHDAPPPPPSGGAVTLQPGQALTLTRALSVFSKSGTYGSVAAFTVAASATDAAQTVTLSALPLVVK